MNDSLANDDYWMGRALDLARDAEGVGEVPVGAVLVNAQGELIGAGYNRCISTHDPTAHAEIVALRAAAAARMNYRLPGTTLYVTLEPCPMCAGAIVNARIARVVYATNDPRAGAAGSVMNVLQHAELNHHAAVEWGLKQAEAASLLVNFFASRRGKA